MQLRSLVEGGLCSVVGLILLSCSNHPEPVQQARSEQSAPTTTSESCKARSMCLVSGRCETIEKTQLELFDAISSVQRELAKELLLDQCAPLNYHVNDIFMSTPLRAAARLNSDYDFELVKLMIDRGAEVNIESKAPWATPLSAAIHYKSNKSARFLLSKGADPTIRDINGANACDIAHRSENYEIIPDLPECPTPNK